MMRIRCVNILRQFSIAPVPHPLRIPYESHFFTTASGGFPMHAHILGPLGSRPLLFIHGLTTNSLNFPGVLRNLHHADGAILIDVRGRGKSFVPDSSEPQQTMQYMSRYRSLEDHASDLVALMDSLSIEKCILAGHSMGSFISLYTCKLHPKRVAGAVLLDGGFPREAGKPGFDQDTTLGVANAIKRLSKSFDSVEEYVATRVLDVREVSADMRQFYEYELKRVGNAFRLRASPEMINCDSEFMQSRFLTAKEMEEDISRDIPIGMVLAEMGFADGSPPMMRPDHVEAMKKALQPVLVRKVNGANHYNVITEDRFGKFTAQFIQDFVQMSQSRK
ncbi:mitochondrial alpha-beta hydrolase [Andalucia godoyi]|uniref:Mitochondrial alpha-beta hydrolase n=1 Tax=Andalucia godoyi TaxID=505711 RepID=A0A8K0F2J3_ANDGO|nr:mitochondrial alpha-beta hydrolase [Andalucia godoyi]|eukprot:ANDGO_03728.mRNA.1 mitochondrial alpha-beta hydrolase